MQYKNNKRFWKEKIEQGNIRNSKILVKKTSETQKI